MLLRHFRSNFTVENKVFDFLEKKKYSSSVYMPIPKLPNYPSPTHNNNLIL